jgi:hypothetical protein
MRNLGGHKVLLILRNPGGTCRNIYGREQRYPLNVYFNYTTILCTAITASYGHRIAIQS